MRKFIMFFLFGILTGSLFAYDIVFEANGKYLLASENSASNNEILELWDITLLCANAPSREINDVTIIRTRLRQSGNNEYYMSTTEVLENSTSILDEFKVTRFGFDVIYEFGILSKVQVKITFKNSNTISDISANILKYDGTVDQKLVLQKSNPRVIMKFE